MAAGLAMAVLALAGCGKKGPIVPPERRLPQPPADMQTTVDDRVIVVLFVSPHNRVDNSRLRDLTLMRLFRREEVAVGPPKPAMRSGEHVVGYVEIVRIELGASPPPNVQVSGDTVVVKDEKGLSLGKRYAYVATAEDASGRISAPSAPAVVTFLAAPASPLGLAARAGDKEVSLHWDAPTTLIDGEPASGELRYIVLRGAGEGGFAPITPAPIAATTYTDTAVSNETTYRYAVKGIRVEPSGSASGPASEAVAATPINTRPPSAPTRVVAIPTSDSVRLAWNASTDADVAEYAIYRAEGSGPFTRVATAPAITTIYTDRDVQSGRTYRYAVTTLSHAKQQNESSRSNEVTVTLP
jgi:predicted small lipoprotein YifL